ncbi:MAG: hypothetical protein NTV43_13055 [Methylococcales bacterium]|nr:hypothetical protein [Methylococcales bacterium]
MLKLLISLLILMLGLPACTPALKKPAIPFNMALVKQISVEISQPNSTGNEATSQVAKNLAGWGYPINTSSQQGVSHVLKAIVGEIKEGSTPTGFSFSAGNSDPRALDFQKMRVLPISCELTSVAHPDQNVFLQMDFVAETVFSKPSQLSEKTLIDHMSTVCFNLLHELDWPEQSPLAAPASNTLQWMPEVRIETISDTLTTEPAEALGKNVAKASDGRKQMIIHNQGAPIILQFGHERR